MNDGYDSLTGDPQPDSFIIPFKNLINDSYCKDISMKIRSSLEVKRKSGEYVGAFAPYGYAKSPDNRSKLIGDEPVAETVKMIFSLYKDGKLDGLLAKLYEDRLSEKITERNFDSLCAKFQTEQEQLDVRISDLTAEVNAKADRQQNIRNWVETIKKYSDPKELTAEMLNALIEKIAVHNAETIENGEKRQKVDIY